MNAFRPISNSARFSLKASWFFFNEFSVGLNHKDLVNTLRFAKALLGSYLSLQEVERDFRTMKTGFLEVRPVFVRKESRTRGHVLCCL